MIVNMNEEREQIERIYRIEKMALFPNHLNDPREAASKKYYFKNKST